MANGKISDPIGTTTKVRTFLSGLIQDLEENPINSKNVKSIIDVAYLLDCISKDAGKYVSKLKKQLEFKEGQYEINGNIARAHKDVHQYSELPPLAFYQEVDAETFINCVKVELAKAKKAIPEERIKEISIPGKETEKIMLQPLSK